MKLTIERAALFRSLGHVQSIVERRNTIPILANVMLEATDGRLSLTATDMDIAIVELVPAVIDIAGSTTAPAHTLYDIVRKLPDGVQIQLDSGSDGFHLGRPLPEDGTDGRLERLARRRLLARERPRPLAPITSSDVSRPPTSPRAAAFDRSLHSSCRSRRNRRCAGCCSEATSPPSCPAPRSTRPPPISKFIFVFAAMRHQVRPQAADADVSSFELTEAECTALDAIQGEHASVLV